MVERRKRYNDEDETVEKRRRMGEKGDGRDIGTNLVEMITKVNEESNIEEAIENLATTLADQYEVYREQIINILSDCVAYAPEKLTVFSTLSGLINAKIEVFGANLIARLVADLNTRFKQNEYDIAIRIVTFFADLGNSCVITLDSIIQFFFVLIDNASEQNLLSDFYIYCVVHSLPWIGAKFVAAQPVDLDDIMSSVDNYLKNRQKNHMKILNVLEQNESGDHNDYLDNLWMQVKKMKDDGWTENHISRYYSKFESVFVGATSQNLPSIVLPAFDSTKFKYPMPHVVFQLFSNDSGPTTGPKLPESNTIERFLVEEDLNWIISNNYLNVRICCKELLNYHKREAIPLEYMIVEIVFGQLFRLPKPAHLELFYGALLIELCRVQSNTMPQVLAQAAEALYKKSHVLHPMCLDRLINWFSYHLSNFQYRWSWADWIDCVETPIYNRRQIFVREVLEKCMRLAYYDKLKQSLPEEFEPLIPSKPQVVFVLGDTSHPAYGQAQVFRKLIQDRADSREILMELKADRLTTEEDINFQYDADMVAVFTAVLIDVSSKTFSHTFAAFTRYVEVFRKVCGSNRDMQSTVLRTAFDCWCKHKQMMEMLVDKLMKMRIVEPISVVSWVFCEDMKNEFHRLWIWGALNLSIYRLDCHATNMEQELAHLKKQVGRQEKFGEGEELEADPTIEIETKQREVEVLQSEIRDLLLLVCHNFTVCLTELLVDLKDANEERTRELKLQFEFVLGRFKHVFLANLEAMWKHIDILNRELFSTADIDPKIAEVYQQFRSLKYS